MSSPLRHERLRRRAELLARLRAFFVERGFLEVETPLIDDEIIPELHIEPFEVLAGDDDAPLPTPGSRELTARRRLWLQASPELHMKRLLAEGLTAIFQVTRSFRRGERGQLHNPEFTIVEWYRTGDDYDAGMTLLEELVTSLVPPSSLIARTTYGQAFELHANVDAYSASAVELAAAAKRLGVSAPEAIDAGDREEWLNLLLASRVEPQLGAAGPEILYDYPSSQAALATTATRAGGVEVAERFELYWRGVELANGYHELSDAAVLRRRLEEVNRKRAAEGRALLPLPGRLLAAMEDPGLPPCSGCALGFDRLAMLLCGGDSINDVMTYPLDRGMI